MASNDNLLVSSLNNNNANNNNRKYHHYNYCYTIHMVIMQHYTAIRTLHVRWTNQFFLDVVRFSTEFGKRSFSYLAPTVWNGLPLNIRLSPTFDTFKRRLKTHILNSPSTPLPCCSPSDCLQCASMKFPRSASDSVPLLNVCTL